MFGAGDRLNESPRQSKNTPETVQVEQLSLQ